MIDFERLFSILGLNSVVEAAPIVLIVAVIYWLVRRRKQKRTFESDFKEVRKKVRLNEIVRTLLLCWLTAVICMTLTPTGFWYSFWEMLTFGPISFPEVNFVRWRFVSVWWTHFVTYSGHYLIGKAMIGELLNAAENIAFFVPIGLALPLVRKKARLLQTTLTAFGCSLFIEFVQAFIGRDGNVDDLICNTLGGVAGYLIYLIIKTAFPKFTDKCKISASELRTA